MQIDVLTSDSAFRTLRPEWLRLLGETSFQSVFFTPQWQEVWWRHFGDGRTLSILTVRSDDGRLEGLGPFMRSPCGAEGTRLEFIGDLELCDYFDVLIAPRRQEEVAQAVADYLVCEVNEDVDIRLSNLSADSPTPLLLQDSLTREGLLVETETSQQDDKQGFMTPAKVAFFGDMAHQLWSEGWMELAFLYADERPIAGLCCMTYGATYAAYNSGYHPGYGSLSAGIVLFADRIRSAIHRGYAAFDFLRGNESYKYRFGASDRPLSQFMVRSACPLQESCV